jgi:hypothetical protein
MKEKALFYLNRKVKELEEVVEVKHTRLAQEGVSYTERMQVQHRADEAANELAAWRWIWDTINGQPDG